MLQFYHVFECLKKCGMFICTMPILDGVLLIAEVKTMSPFGFKSENSWDELFEVANKFGDIISIHTDPRWGGSFELLEMTRMLTNKPILAKGIHKSDAEIKRAIQAGADYVLVVGRIPNIYVDKLLIEPLEFSEIVKIPKNLKLVWNSRDILTGGQKKETIADIRKIWDGWLCQASNISSENDINPSVQAILVGKQLRNFVRSV